MFFRPYFCNMHRKRIYLFLFLLLTFANIAVFILRDQFTYQPLAGYNALYAPCNESCFAKWRQYADDYSSELKEAKQITDPVIQGYSQTSDKVIAIENFLYAKFHKQMGRPTVGLMESSPLAQFKKLDSSGSIQLWCGNFAHMLSLFCWSQGIVTRNVELQHAADKHLLNECYLPELKLWMMADITNNMLAVTTGNGKFLNVISFKNSLEQKPMFNIIQSTGTGSLQTDSLRSIKIPVQYVAADPVNFYHYTDNYKAYSIAEKIKRYFLPVSWYETYESKSTGNLTFYLKEMLILLWLVSFFVFLLTRTKFRP
jgi:hypothetical protein